MGKKLVNLVKSEKKYISSRKLEHLVSFRGKSSVFFLYDFLCSGCTLEAHTDKHMCFLNGTHPRLATERGQKGIHQARRQFREKTHDTDGGLNIF